MWDRLKNSVIMICDTSFPMEADQVEPHIREQEEGHNHTLHHITLKPLCIIWMLEMVSTITGTTIKTQPQRISMG